MGKSVKSGFKIIIVGVRACTLKISLKYLQTVERDYQNFCLLKISSCTVYTDLPYIINNVKQERFLYILNLAIK